MRLIGSRYCRPLSWWSW